jgi:hypothetical protein
MGLFIKLREASRLQREARIAAAEKAGNPGSDYVDEAQVFYEELDYAKYPKCVIPFITWGLGVHLVLGNRYFKLGMNVIIILAACLVGASFYPELDGSANLERLEVFILVKDYPPPPPPPPPPPLRSIDPSCHHR